MSEEDIWYCKIGGDVGEGLPCGSDAPMRAAIADAFQRLTGRRPQFIFSGWGAELTESERAVHENRVPSAEYYAQCKLIAAAPDLLAACQRTLEHPGVPLCDCGEPDCATTLMRAAIAKATL